MLLEVLNAPDVQLANRDLHGKRTRQAERAGHALQRIIDLHPRGRRRGDNRARTGTAAR